LIASLTPRSAGSLPAPVATGSQTALQPDGGRIARRPTRRLVPALGQQLVAGVVDHIALAVELELTVAAVEGLAALAGHLEEASPVDRQIHRVARRGDVALRELLRHGQQVDADAGAGGAGPADRGGIHVAELRTRRLGSKGARVGNVVADDLEVLAGGAQTGETLLEAHAVSLEKRGDVGSGKK